MSVPFSNTKLRVPRGFQNLLEGLAREVLRTQPEDIHDFAWHYFEDLVSVRDGGGVDPAAVGADFEDRFYNNKAFQSPDADVSNPDHQKAALQIQTKYRQFHAKKEVAKKREEQAAVTIQAGIRGYHARKEVEDMKKDEPEADTAPEEEIDIDLNDPEVGAAATKIQASFKGHKARKEVQSLKDKQKAEEEAAAMAAALAAEKPAKEKIDINLDDPEVSNAAVKIQANFRGYKVRKGTKDSKNADASEGEGNALVEESEVAAVEDKPVDKEHVDEETLLVEESKDEPEETANAKPEEEEIDIDLDDPETAKAAVKIQASFRGHQSRKSKDQTKAPAEKDDTPVEDIPPPTESAETADKQPEQQEATDVKKEQEEEIDIDLDDPETAKAAVKIQASFRGHMSRKNKNNNAEAPEGGEEGDATTEVEAAPETETGAAGEENVEEEAETETGAEQEEGVEQEAETEGAAEVEEVKEEQEAEADEQKEAEAETVTDAPEAEKEAEPATEDEPAEEEVEQTEGDGEVTQETQDDPPAE